MTDLSPIRRKIGAPRPGAGPPPLDPRRVWRRALSHGLSRAIGLDVAVEASALDAVMPEDVAVMVEEGALCALLDGPCGYGVAILSGGLVTSMIEMMTMGRVPARPALPRMVTGTDAAMLADPLDRVLQAQEALAGDLTVPMAAGYRYATHLPDLRQIVLSLSDAGHDHTRLEVSVGPGGLRKGRVDLVLPRMPVAQPDGTPKPDWSTQMNARLMGSEVTIRAELARLTLPVGRVQGLGVGAVIPVSRHLIGRVRMVTCTGALISEGRLGQSAGRKAVRLCAPAADPFAQVELARAAAPEE